jgi:hypothetical protein
MEGQVMTGRTLNEMTQVERSNMMVLVAQALDSVAEDAEDRGEEVSARNANYLAQTIRGCGTSSSIENRSAAELLLEQGITYVASLAERFEQDDHEADAGENAEAGQLARRAVVLN